MAKKPIKTKPIPKPQRRNPESQHVKTWTVYRKRKEKPKAKLTSERKLTFPKYVSLMADYHRQAMSHLGSNKLRPQKQFRAATISPFTLGFTIAREMVRDFGRTKGLKAFGYGVAYGQFLFFMKNFMKAKVKGVDLGDYSKTLTQQKKLGVKHLTDAANTSLRKQGKFDVTYSINLVETDIVDKPTALKILDNIAAMTKKGGKSYHIITSQGTEFAVSRAEIEARGFRIDKWIPVEDLWTFVKLIKVKD